MQTKRTNLSEMGVVRLTTISRKVSHNPAFLALAAFFSFLSVNSAAQPAFPTASASDNQSAGGPNYMPYAGPRNTVGNMEPRGMGSEPRQDFYSVCYQRAPTHQWAQQVDAHISRQLKGSDWTGLFGSYSNPYARKESEMQAQCMAVQQYDAVAFQWGGLHNVPTDMLQTLDRNLYLAFVTAPQVDAARRADTTNRRLQERAADSLLRSLRRRQ